MLSRSSISEHRTSRLNSASILTNSHTTQPKFATTTATTSQVQETSSHEAPPKMSNPTSTPEVTMESLFASLQIDRLISIYIGDSPTPILVPQSTLVRTSNFFRGALTRDCKEAKEGKIYFPEDDLRSWKVLIYWIIDRKFPDFDQEQNDGGAEHIKNFSAWYLGDRLCIHEFQDDMIKYMVRTFANGMEKLLYRLEVKPRKFPSIFDWDDDGANWASPPIPASSSSQESSEQDQPNNSAALNELFMHAFKATELGGIPRDFVANHLVEYMETTNVCRRKLTWNEITDVRKIPAYTLDIVEAMAARQAEDASEKPIGSSDWYLFGSYKKYMVHHTERCECDICARG